jgi:hypothetical protein
MTLSLAYNISARTTQKTPSYYCVHVHWCRNMFIEPLSRNGHGVDHRKHRSIVECMLRVLPSNGHFLHSHRLAKGLYATIPITFHGKKLPVLHTTPIPEDSSWLSYLYFRASMGKHTPISDDDVLLFYMINNHKLLDP